MCIKNSGRYIMAVLSFKEADARLHFLTAIIEINLECVLKNLLCGLVAHVKKTSNWNLALIEIS